MIIVLASSMHLMDLTPMLQMQLPLQILRQKEDHLCMPLMENAILRATKLMQVDAIQEIPISYIQQIVLP
jgi:hypothetical protein